MSRKTGEKKAARPPWPTLALVSLVLLATLVFLISAAPIVATGSGSIGAAGSSLHSQRGRRKKVQVSFPPSLPAGKSVVTDSSPRMLEAPTTLRPGVSVAKSPPTVDFLYYPGQDYPGKPWSAWGDSLAVDGRYYASIGDHLAPAGNAFVYEYDPRTKRFRQLLDVRELLDLPDGHYTPGKIHGRIDMGKDGWLYLATHRGSSRVTNDRYHFKGDWIIRLDPENGEAQIVAHGPVAKHSIPAGVLDPERLIFYGGTVAGESDEIRFFAYDAARRRLLYTGPEGPARYMILARSTGRVYFTRGNDGKYDDGALVRYDPVAGGSPVEIAGTIGIRAATGETPQGLVYAVSQARRGEDATLWSFDVQTERIENLDSPAVGTQTYITSIDADPSGRYLYYVAGAHGGSWDDGSPLVQFDTRTKRKKVIAFLHPFYETEYGARLAGTFSLAVDPSGDKVYITWNVSRGSRAWDSCALTVVHIPRAER